MSDQGGPDEIKMLTRLADRVREFRETKGAPPCPIWPEEAHAIRIVLQRVKDSEARLREVVEALRDIMSDCTYSEVHPDDYGPTAQHLLTARAALAAAQTEDPNEIHLKAHPQYPKEDEWSRNSSQTIDGKLYPGVPITLSDLEKKKK